MTTRAEFDQGGLSTRRQATSTDLHRSALAIINQTARLDGPIISFYLANRSKKVDNAMCGMRSRMVSTST